jgi:translation initiation factor IF-3
LRYPYRNQPRADEKQYVFGRFIREQKIYCIDQNNTNLGLIDTRDALQLASDAGLELVMVSQGKAGNPSTCKILDLGKHRYEQEKKDKVVKKKQRDNAIRLKEIKFHPSTDDNDLLTKARQFQEFISEGNRLKVTVVFRGREMAHRDLGIEKMSKFAKMICAQYDAEPMVSGRNMTAVLVKSDQKAEK